jgi:hypothetical protein
MAPFGILTSESTYLPQPSRLEGQWLSVRRSSSVTVAGPCRILTGFPVNLLRINPAGGFVKGPASG